MLELLISDPVVWGSILGILIMIGMGAYYAYYFVHNVHEDEKYINRNITHSVYKYRNQFRLVLIILLCRHNSVVLAQNPLHQGVAPTNSEFYV
jgi:hypothetical protein